jgi:uncharacterized GH25 family protein
MILFRPGFARRSVKPNEEPCHGLRAGGKPVPTPHQVRGRLFRDHAPTIAFAAAVAAAGSARAHDLWIEPSTFRPTAGAPVAVGLRVGQNFLGDPVPRISRAIERFTLRQGGGEQPIVGIENNDPAGWLRTDGGATAMIVYCSEAFFIELPAEKFEDYLRQEGLDRVIAQRNARGEHAKPGREYFSRYAKALLTGERSSAEVTQPLGLAYEIVPEADPTGGAAPLRGRVLYGGKPLADVLVVAIWRDDPSVRLTAHSDTRGAFSFDLPRAGVWLVKSVHMVRTWFFSRADWESLWASLTFAAPAAHAAGQPPGAR